MNDILEFKLANFFEKISTYDFTQDASNSEVMSRFMKSQSEFFQICRKYSGLTKEQIASSSMISLNLIDLIEEGEHYIDEDDTSLYVKALKAEDEMLLFLDIFESRVNCRIALKVNRPNGVQSEPPVTSLHISIIA